MDYLKEFQFDPESSARIAQVIKDHPMSLKDVADLLEMIAPLATLYTPDGAALILNMILCEPEFFRLTATKYRDKMNDRARELWRKGGDI